MLGAFNVNGASCELLVDQDALVWWPRISTNVSSHNGNSYPKSASSNSLPSPIKQLKRISKGGFSYDLERSATDEHCDDSRAEELRRHQRRVEFNLIIGVTRVFSKSRDRSKKRHSDGNARDLEDGETRTSTTTRQSDSEIRQSDIAQASANSVRRLTRLKIYYAKRNEKKSTGRLLKFKKISLSSLCQKHDVSTHQQQHIRTSRTESTSTSSSSPPVSLDEPSQPECKALEGLYELIEQHLELKRRQRPKRLLVFVNPYGGKGKALHLYKSRVRKLFDLAQIEHQLVVTKYANHARNTIEDPMFELDGFDGIVCIGGDGMFAELMNGLLFRYNRDKVLKNELNLINKRLCSGLSIGDDSRVLDLEGQTIDDKTETKDEEEAHSEKQRRVKEELKELRSSLGGIGEQFLSPTIPIGVIGAGSTDANLFGFIGTNDSVSATLNIVLGNQIHIDVCSIHSIQEDRLLRFVSTFVAYGYFGDVIRESEKLRWLGPSRYDVTALNSLIRYRCYNGLVRVLRSKRDGTPLDLNRCHRNCSLCNQTSNNTSNNISNNNNDVKYLDSFEFSKTFPAAGDLGKVEKAKSAANSGSTTGKSLVVGEDEFEILEEEGSFVGVNAAVTACRCPQTRKGFSPGNHLANGCADLILVRPCSRMQYLNYLIRTGYTSKSAFDLRYVDAYRCRQFEFIVQQEQQQQQQQASDRKNDTHAADDFATSDYQSKGSTKLSTNDTSITSSQQSSNANSLDTKQYSNHQVVDCLGGHPERHPQSADQRHAIAKVADDSLEDAMEDGHQTGELVNELAMSSWNVDGEILREQSIRVKVNNKLLRVFGTGEPQPRSMRRRKQSS